MRGRTAWVFAGLALAMASGARLVAQDRPPTEAEKQQQVADILARHADVSPEQKALGDKVFAANCAACHDNGVNRAPPRATLAYLSPDAVYRTLTVGQMKAQASGLTQQEKVAVAEAIGGRRLGADPAAAGPKMCAASDWFDAKQPPPLAGWGLDARNAHSVPASVAGIPKPQVGKLKLKWAVAFPGAIHARSQPTLAGGALFVGSDNGLVYALDPASGCAHWTFDAGGPVRMGIVADNWALGQTAANPRLYFGTLTGKAFAVDARTGKQVWSRTVDSHPNATLTGAFALDGDALYIPIASLEEPTAANPAYACCTFRGSLLAVDAATGKDKWRTFLVDEPKVRGKSKSGADVLGPSGVATWSTPLVDHARNRIYLTTGDNYSSPATAMSDAVIALDRADGRVAWVRQVLGNDAWNASCGFGNGANCPDENGPDHDFGAGPAMAKGKDGRDVLLAGQKSGLLYGIDPDTGAVRWTERAGRGGTFGGIHFGIAALNGVAYAPEADLPDGAEHEFPARPGIHAFDAATGKPLWSAIAADICNGKRFCAPGYGAAITVTDGLVFAGAMDGHLRAFDSATGKILWDVDSTEPVVAVDGSKASGGSFAGGTAPIPYHGMLFATSGYGGLGRMPGNVLLAYGLP